MIVKYQLVERVVECQNNDETLLGDANAVPVEYLADALDCSRSYASRKAHANEYLEQSNGVDPETMKHRKGWVPVDNLVFVTPGGNYETFHLKRCGCLSDDAELKPLTRQKLNESRELCNVCEDGSEAFAQDTDRTAWRTLRDANPEDLEL